MKLAEGLLLRADLQKKLASLRDRAARYAVVQDGESPPEDPADLLRQLDGAANEFSALVTQINVTNLATALPGGETLTAALARRDVLKLKHAAISAVIDAAVTPPGRHGLSEIRWVPTVTVADWQVLADALAKDIRELNAAIQQAGWAADLI